MCPIWLLFRFRVRLERLRRFAREITKITLPCLQFGYFTDLGLDLRGYGDSLRDITKITLLCLQLSCKKDLGLDLRD